MLNEGSLAFTLTAKPALVSFSLSDPGDLVKRVHDAGLLVMHQVTTVQQARQAAERGVDVIIAQGCEAGAFVGTVAGLALIPQVVGAVSPIPVIADGGIADGRGLGPPSSWVHKGSILALGFWPRRKPPSVQRGSRRFWRRNPRRRSE
jgi:hypothetical protein